MKHIHQLLKSISEQERFVFENFLISSTNHDNTKYIQMYKALLDPKGIPLTDETYSKLLYKHSNSKNFQMVKSRFKSKLLDTILLDVNLDRVDDLDRMDHATVVVKKRLAQLHLYRYNNREFNVIKNLLDETIQTAKSYELYDELVECLKMKKYLKGFRIGKNEFDKYQAQINHYSRCAKAAHDVKDVYYNLMMQTAFSGEVEKNKTHNLSIIRTAVKRIAKENKILKSKRVEFYLKYAELRYYLLTEDYNKAQLLALEFHNFILDNKVVKRVNRVGASYGHLYDTSMVLGKYKKALEYIKISDKYFPKGSTNYFINKEMEYYPLMYLGHYNKALRNIRYLNQYSHLASQKFRGGRYDYLMAIVLFEKGKYREALDIHLKNDGLLKDKSGWNIWQRIATIQAMIELDETELASDQLESLRKHIARHTFKDRNHREKLILQLLTKADKYSFRFGMINQELIKDAIKKLGSMKKPYKWEILTPEIIPFQNWLTNMHEHTYHTKKLVG